VYMSPEQAGGAGHVDGRSDIYSLACVLFEMLAGEPPFSGGTPQAVIAKHMQAPVPDLRVVRSTVSSDLQRTLETALAKVPADRFETGEQFAASLGTTSRDTVPPARWRTALAGSGALLLVAVASALVFSSTRSGGLTAPADQSTAGPSRIAVLYFDDRSADSGLRQIADGITEELIYELSGVGGFRVISRNAMQPYRGRQVPLDSILAALHPTMVVDGSVQRVADRIRVRVQLIDAISGTYLDSLSLEQPMGDPNALERTAAQGLAAGLRRDMGREVRLRTAPLGTGSAVASELARKAQGAREEAREIAESPHAEDLRTAIEALRRADSLLALAGRADPDWSRVWIDRGWVAADRAGLLVGSARVAALKDGMRLAEEAVRRAPDSAQALELRGTLRERLVVELQAAPDEPDRLRKAEADLRAALDRDSTLTRAWATLSDLLWTKGSTAEAAIAARRALQEDTYLAEAPNIYYYLFLDDLMLGNFSNAAEWCRRGRLTFPGRWRFVQCELTLMRHDADARPNPDSAWKLVATLERLDPPDRAKSEGRAYHTIYRRIVAATISARAGRPDIGRAEIARARRATKGDTTLDMDLNYDEAYLLSVLGERRRAAALLRAYINARPLSRDYLARDPLLQSLPLRR
jgi:TolB-like protein